MGLGHYQLFAELQVNTSSNHKSPAPCYSLHSSLSKEWLGHVTKRSHSSSLDGVCSDPYLRRGSSQDALIHVPTPEPDLDTAALGKQQHQERERASPRCPTPQSLYTHH